MTTRSGSGTAEKVGKFAPLAEPTFRRIWTSSLFSNFGQLILGVGAAWEMTRLSDSPQMVALVQTAMMVPLMLVNLPAGAMADMYDRRKIALFGLGFSILCSATLAALTYFGMVTPWMLLAFCVLIGGGVALYGPSWQASIGEQVKPDHLPQAIALGSVSYNMARSVGPALGGLIVLAFGAQAAFSMTAAFYIPLWLAFMAWRRQHTVSRLPPERMDRAVLSGVRYATHSQSIRSVIFRSFAFGFGSATSTALAPLVARDLLHGNAATYGVLLGASGIGAVMAGLYVGELRSRFSNNRVVRACIALTALAFAVIGYSQWLWLTCVALFVAGGCNITAVGIMNVSVQLSAPRWVTARALSLFASGITAGIALGAWLSGLIASHHGVAIAFSAATLILLANMVLSMILPLPENEDEDHIDRVSIGSAPHVALDVTMRSGPVVVEVEYDVDPAQARDFYAVMMKVEKVRKRIGGFDWSISRDIGNPAIWIERYRCPTWGDYLRMRGRYTQSELEVQEAADSFDRSEGERHVRRWLERPYGSVRWKAETPDNYRGTVDYLAP